MDEAHSCCIEGGMDHAAGHHDVYSRSDGVCNLTVSAVAKASYGAGFPVLCMPSRCISCPRLARLQLRVVAIGCEIVGKGTEIRNGIASMALEPHDHHHSLTPAHQF